MQRIVRAVVRTAVCASVLLAPAAMAGPLQVTDFGTLGGSIYVHDMNEAGQIVGRSQTGAYVNGNSVEHAFIRNPGTLIRDLGTLGGADSWANAISEAGVVAGFSRNAANKVRAFVWSPQTGMVDLGVLSTEYAGAADAQDVNSAGQVVGYIRHTQNLYTHSFLVNPLDSDGDGRPDRWFQDANGDGANDLMVDLGLNGETHRINEAGVILIGGVPSMDFSRSYLWRNGALTDLGSLGGGGTKGYALSEQGAVAGTSFPGAYAARMPFYWKDGVMTAIGLLPGCQLGGVSTAAVNDSGQVVGICGDSSYRNQAYHWQEGIGLTALPTLGGAASEAHDINNHGVVTGRAELASGDLHAFIWSRETGIADLGTILGQVSTGYEVNDAGQVAGLSTFAANSYTPHGAFWGENLPPIAKAGAGQTVHPGVTVTLDGSGSTDPDGNYPLSYAWSWVTLPPGSAAALADAATASASFILDVPGNYVVQLIVTDATGLASAASAVTISTQNTTPVAAAGSDQAITLVGALVTLDGTTSYDEDGDPLSFRWSITAAPAGSAASLADADSPAPSFTADVHGDFRIALTVSDPWSSSAPDEVLVSFTNVAPVAHAGANQSVVQGSTVILDGSASSDANGDALAFSWSLASRPEGSTAALDDPSAVRPAFPADLPGTYIASLTVTDRFVASEPSNASILVVSAPDAAMAQLQHLIAAVNLVPDVAFKNATMRNAMTNKLNAAVGMVGNAYYAQAWDKLTNDVLPKADGCASGGGPDSNDWITDCQEQTAIGEQIEEILVLLSTLF